MKCNTNSLGKKQRKKEEKSLRATVKELKVEQQMNEDNKNAPHGEKMLCQRSHKNE